MNNPWDQTKQQHHRPIDNPPNLDPDLDWEMASHGGNTGIGINPDEEDSEDDTIPVRTGPLDMLPANSGFLSVLVFYGFCLIASLNYWNQSALADWLWVSHQSVFGSHEYFRLWTAVLSHADLAHLLANTPLLLVFGFYLRAFFGFSLFPVLSFFMGGLINLFTVYFYSPQARLVGASGMVYFMAAMWLVLYLRFDVRFSFKNRLLRSLGFVMIVLAPTSFSPQTSYLAHGLGFGLGGVIAIVLCFLIRPVSYEDGDNATGDQSSPSAVVAEQPKFRKH